MIQCRRLGYAVLSTRNIADQIRYYSHTLGLYAVSQDDRRAVLATRHGVECIVLESGADAGLTGLSFEIGPAISLADARKLLAEAGVNSEIRQGKTANTGEVLAFKDPRGSEVELFNEIRFAETDMDDRGVGILKLGHIASYVEDLEKVTAFYIDVLGFRRSDWISGLADFLRCGPDHHTVNFFKSGANKLNHIAFEVKDFAELVRASDMLVRNNLPLEWGPARHMIGHNCACYHYNDDKLRMELYAEMDQMKDEALGYFEPRPWHEDKPQRPKDWAGLNPVRNKWIPAAPWPLLETAQVKASN